MDYEAMIEDEEVFTRPWKIQMKLYKKVGDDAQLQQFKCVEFVEELIYGEWRAKLNIYNNSIYLLTLDLF